MFKNVSNFITGFWEKSADYNQLIFFEKFIFFTLCCFEKVYCIGFSLSQFLKRSFGFKKVAGLKIISVGNLSVGGTGKSVFVQSLVEIFGKDRCGIISRGYGGKLSRWKNVVVSNEIDPEFYGDEPYMLAQTLGIPVVVGRDRFKSCLLLSDCLKGYCQQGFYAILDDGYQNHNLRKDFEILLIDARTLFGNNHCLPAGPMREKDYSRSDVIILTHSDEIDEKRIFEIKSNLLSKFTQSRIFCGKHAPDGLFLFNQRKIENHAFKNRRFLLVAGIGSFQGFVQSVKKIGVRVEEILQFPDHYRYSKKDTAQMYDIVQKYNLDGIITTQKDWSKLFRLVDSDEKKFLIYVFRISFEFLSDSEYSTFKNILLEQVK